MKFLVCTLAMLAVGTPWAQEFRGTFSGIVTDAQGSAIPKVRITATETETGTKSETFSSTPGEYRIMAEVAGFKTYTRKGLTLSLGEHPVVDIKLEVGQASQSVMVTAEVPMIESSNASLGQVISTDEVENMPTNGRTPMMLSRLAMGVISTNEPGPVRPFDNGAVSSFSISGGPSGQNGAVQQRGFVHLQQPASALAEAVHAWPYFHQQLSLEQRDRQTCLPDR